MQIFETRVGAKKIHGRRESIQGDVVVKVDCEVYGMVSFKITKHQADLLFVPRRTKVIQEIVPNLHPSLREVFLTGMTPAEWDKCMGLPVKPVESYPGYQQPT